MPSCQTTPDTILFGTSERAQVYERHFVEVLDQPGKSDFKVVYGNGSGSRNESDFNSEMNIGGTDWHTSEDL